MKTRERPARFVIKLKEGINARLLEVEFPGCREKKSRKRKISVNQDYAEETWKKRKCPGKPSVPRIRKVPQEKENQPKASPDLPKWGGKIDNMLTLVNTCTIDIGLVITFLKYEEEARFQKKLVEDTNSLNNDLLTVFKLMKEKDFDAAKLVWLTHIQQPLEKCTDLYGDESDLFFLFINRLWTSVTRSQCSSTDCPGQTHDSRSTHHGIDVR